MRHRPARAKAARSRLTRWPIVAGNVAWWAARRRAWSTRRRTRSWAERYKRSPAAIASDRHRASCAASSCSTRGSRTSSSATDSIPGRRARSAARCRRRAPAELTRRVRNERTRPRSKSAEHEPRRDRRDGRRGGFEAAAPRTPSGWLKPITTGECLMQVAINEAALRQSTRAFSGPGKSDSGLPQFPIVCECGAALCEIALTVDATLYSSVIADPHDSWSSPATRSQRRKWSSSDTATSPLSRNTPAKHAL